MHPDNSRVDLTADAMELSSDLSEDDLKQSHKCDIPARYTLVALSFCGFFCLFALRVNLSVAIVAMVNYSAIAPPVSNSSSYDLCPVAYANTTIRPKFAGEFAWPPRIQGIILGSIFYGAICTQILGGWISKKWGAKHPFGLSVLFSGIFALFIPLASRHHYGALVALRVLQGLFQGVALPSIHSIMGLWAPPLERSRMVISIYSGIQIGTVGALLISGVLMQHFGWDSTFYFFGGLACFWYVFWIFFAFNSPATHPRISEKERAYITRAISARALHHSSGPTPWKKLFTSLPVWAICIASFGHNWAFYTLLTNIPTYLKTIQHFNIQSNGLLSSLPYFIMAGIMLCSAFGADFLLKRKILSTTWVRRIFHVAGQILPACFLVALGYVGCDRYAAIALLVLAVGTDGIATAGFTVNDVDIAPRHSGVITGLSNTLGAIPGIIAPYIVGVIFSGPMGQSISQWRIVFDISAALYVITALFFGFCASGELQDWAS